MLPLLDEVDELVEDELDDEELVELVTLPELDELVEVLTLPDVEELLDELEVTLPEVDDELVTFPDELLETLPEDDEVELLPEDEVTLPDEVEVEVETPPVEVETPPVEVETPPVVVELVIPPLELLVELPPEPPEELEVEPPEVEVEPVLVEETTTLPPPLLPPPKNPPKKPPPNPPLEPPITIGTPPEPPWCSGGIGGKYGAGIGTIAICCGAAQEVVRVIVRRRRWRVGAVATWRRAMWRTARGGLFTCLTYWAGPRAGASATCTAPPPISAPPAAQADNFARAIRTDISLRLLSLSGPATIKLRTPVPRERQRVLNATTVLTVIPGSRTGKIRDLR